MSDIPRRQYLYSIMVIDAHQLGGYRTETVLGYAHSVDDLTLVILVDGPRARQYFNWRWVLGFSREEVAYAGAAAAAALG